MTSLFFNVFLLPRQTQFLQLLSILFNSIYPHLFPGGMQVAAHIWFVTVFVEFSLVFFFTHPVHLDACLTVTHTRRPWTSSWH